MPARLEALGPAPRWDDFLTHTYAKAMIGRVSRCRNLTTNLTKMMRVVSDLHTNNYGPIVDESLHLVRRLSWIMFYFYGAMSRFAVWMSSQTVRGSVAQDNEQVWIGFVNILEKFFEILVFLPNDWAVEGNNKIVDDHECGQQIPAETPLELVVQIYLNLHDPVDNLDTPDAIQSTLRQMAVAYQFPGYNLGSNALPRGQEHDGFSNCIFVTQSDVHERALLAGSTLLCLEYFHDTSLTQIFKDLRLRRFEQGQNNNYDIELRARFRNPDDVSHPKTTPKRRYLSHRRGPDSHSPNLVEYANQVRFDLISEYAGLRRAYPGRAQAPLPENEQRMWEPFTYEYQRARSTFVLKLHRNQQTLFEATPRCLKCRVIHSYDIVNEDMEVKANANNSCQCAEDIVYGKLRELGSVGSVILMPFEDALQRDSFVRDQMLLLGI